MDDSIKSIMIDSSKPVKNVVETIGQKLDLKNSEEYSVRRATAGESMFIILCLFPLPKIWKRSRSCNSVVRLCPESASPRICLSSSSYLFRSILAEWLDNEKTLYELEVKEDEMLFFAKRYFNNDFNIDKDDPMQLHLIYIQAVASVVKGKYDPLQRQEAIDLASVQVQIMHGNHDPNKHKPGFIDINKVLPDAWRKDKKIELDILKEHKKLVGTIEMNAKYRYVQLVRSLKTYGITFFNVVEKVKTKKKPVPVLLGITKDKIMKMDPETRQPIKEWSLEQMRRWAATNTTFTLDFGDYEDDYVIVQTTEGEAISALIAGYIDILLKNQQESHKNYEENDGQVGTIDQVAVQYGNAVGTMTTSATYGMGGQAPQLMNITPGSVVPGIQRVGGAQGYNVEAVGSGGPGVSKSNMAFPNAQKINVMDMSTALLAAKALTAELGNGVEGFGASGSLTADQWKDQMNTYMNGMNSDIMKLLDQARMDPSHFDKNALDGTAKSLHSQVIGMAIAAKNIAALDGNTPLLNGAKAVSESISRLLGSLNKYADNPNDPRFALEMAEAERALKASTMALDQARQAHYVDKGAELLMLECVGDISANLDDMIDASLAALNEINDPASKQRVSNEAEGARAAKEWLLGSITAMAPVAIDQNIQFSMLEATTSITTVSNKLVSTTKTAGAGMNTQRRLDWAAKRLNDAIKLLLESRSLVEARGAEGDLDIETPANLLQAALSQVRKNIDNPKELVAPTKNGLQASNTLIRATKTLADASDDATRDRLLKAAKNMGEYMQKMLNAVKVLHNDPGNAKAREEVLDSAARLEAFGQDIVTDAGVTAALTALRFYAKSTTAKMIKLQSASNASFVAITDEVTRNALWQLGGQLADQITSMIESLKTATAQADNFVVQNELLMATKTNIPGFHQFLVEALKSQKHIVDLNKKQDVSYAVTDASEALKKLEKACKTVGDIGGQTEIEQALEDFDAVNVDLDAAEFAADQGLLTGVPGQTRENAQELLTLATRTLATTLEHMTDSAKMGGKLSAHVKDSAAAIGQVAGAVRSMASTTPDRPTQRRIIAAAKGVTADTLHLIGSGRVLIIDRTNGEKVRNVDLDYSKVKSSMATLIAAAKGLDARECDEAVNNIRNESAKLTTNMPTAATFKQASEGLASVSKALSAAISQLTAMARSNPRGVGAAAKITSSTMSQMVQAVNVAASTAESGVGADLINAARGLADAMVDLMNAAKSAAANRDADSIEDLNKVSTKVNDTLQGVLAALGGAVSPEAEDAVRAIMDAIQNLDKLDGVDGKSRAQLLEEFSVSAQALAAITTRLVTASRVSAAKMGVFSKEAAVTIAQLVDAARAASKAPAEGSGGSSPVSAAAQDMMKCCQFIMNSPNELQKVIAVSKKAAQCAAQLIAGSKDVAGKLSGPEDKNKQQRVLKAAKLMANDASRLAKAAQIAGTSKDATSIAQMIDCAKSLKDQTKELDDACAESGVGGAAGGPGDAVDSSTAQRLSAASRTVGVSVAELIRTSAAVASNKGSDEANAELSKSTKAMGEALSSLVSVTAALNPGIQECLKAEEALQVINTDLDALAIALSAGSAALPDPGKTHAQMQEELVDVCKALGDDVVSVSQSATASNVNGLVDGAKKVQVNFAAFQAAVRGAVATSATPQAQKYYLDTAKMVVDQVLGLLKQVKVVNPSEKVSVDTLTAYANNSGQAIGYIIAALQSGVAMVRDIEKVMAEMNAVVGSVGTPLEGANKKRYGQYREDVAAYASRDLADLVQKISNTAPETVGQLGLHAKRVGDGFAPFVTNVRGAAGTTTDAAARQAIVAEATAFSKALLAVLEQAKAVARDAQNPVSQQQLRTAAQPFFAETAKLIAALRKGASGEVMCDNAIAEIQKSVTQMNTAAIFAQAGQLEPDKNANALTVTKLQESLLAAAAAVTGGARGVGDATKKNQDAVGQAATQLANLVAAVAQAATQTASRVGDSSLQQDVLSAAKMLGIRSHQVILAAKDIERAPNDASVLSTLAQALDGINEAINSLSNIAQGVTASAAAGERELENARKVIFSLMQSVPGYDAATPEDVVKAARDVTASVADLVFANAQEEIVAAAQKSLVATEKLLNSAVTASKLSPDPSVSKAIVDSSRATAQTMITLLDVAKLNRADPATQQKREDASADVTNSLNSIVTALRALPNAQNLSLDEGADLESVANEELLKAAKVIEEAAAALQRARPQRKNVDPNILDEAAITDAILGAAHAIAQATGSLVGAATAAQNERAQRQKNAPAGAKYRNDPTWANGLISAAKAVAGAVRQLVNAANAAAQGKADQEVLIASARTVAAATAQLVAACRAKADPLSKSQQTLTVAAKAVSDATSKLVSAAQQAANFTEADTDAPDGPGFSQTMQAKFDQQIKILKLEAAIEAERKRLAKMNKAEYNK